MANPSNNLFLRQHHHPHPTALQPKNASILAPIVVLDSAPASPAVKSSESGILSSQMGSLAIQESETFSSHFPTREQTTFAFTPSPPVQLRVSINVDQEQYHEKMVKAKLHLVLVLTALVQMPDGRQTWNRLEGHFVKALPLQVQENFLGIGFTLLVVPPANTSSKVLEAFPTLDGLLPWAETSVAIEHFVAGSSDSTQSGMSDNGMRFSAPLMEIPILPDSGLRRTKHTVATIEVIVGETYPRIPPLKTISEKRRIGPSFSQTYYGHSIRGTILYAREHLYESPLAFALPIKLLQFLAQDEKRVSEELEKDPETTLSELIQAVPLDHRPNPITRGTSFMETLRRNATRSNSLDKEHSVKSTKARQSALSEEDSHLQKLLRQQISAHRNIEAYYQNMVTKMEQKLKENMEIGQGPFRRSPEKKDEAVQWVPLNCCIQEFLVNDDGYQTNYQTTTVGAAAAHSAGFSRSNGYRQGNAPSFGAYWDKQEKGNDLKRDFRALQDVMESCSSEFITLLTSETVDKPRLLALVKEIVFLKDEIVNFSTYLLAEYLTPLSTEGTARSVCYEIENLITRLREIDLGRYDDQSQDQTSDQFSLWLDRCRLPVKEIVRCSIDLRGFIHIAIQHECLVTDATLVAGADWIIEKRTRECSFSQLTATVATSFLAILEDWWTNMVSVLQGNGFKGTEHINVEHIGKNDIPRGSVKRRPSTARQAHEQSAKRRPSLRSTISNVSSTSSTTGRFGRIFSKHPLDDYPQAKAHNTAFWDQLVNLGWLIQIESLLSTQGNELGMLLDYFQAIADVRDNITIGFHLLPQSSPILPTEQDPDWNTNTAKNSDEAEDTIIQISGRRGRLMLSFGLDSLQFSLLPESLRAGTSKIQVHPVLFSQGINEMQTLSNLTGKSPLQQSINEESLRYMQNYVSRYQAWHAQSQEVTTQGHDRAKTGTHGRHTLRGGLADLSSASLVSNPDSDWDMVSPSRAEIWNGEPLVVQLLGQLEKAILGHSDETKSSPISTLLPVSLPESTNVQIVYPSQSTLSALDSGILEEPTPGLKSGILGSVMEYGQSRFFNSKGYKNTDILECAEALTRALGQVKMPINVHTESITRPENPESSPTLPLSSLWVTSHLVSCKSAKDRTSMSVTLSQVNLLRTCHGLEVNDAEYRGGDWKAILDAMRSEVGVRIKSVERNLKIGEFAKDLLWISAFGESEPQRHGESVFGSASSSDQAHCSSQDIPDALTYVRSLIPQSSQSSLQTIPIQSEIVTDNDQSQAESDYVEIVHGPIGSINGDTQNASEVNGNDFHSVSSNDSGLMADTEGDSNSSILEQQLPPMKLMRSSTGPALAPVVTLGDELNQAENGRHSPGQNARTSPISISVSRLPGTNHTNENYQSFPGSFDEPVLAVRLARSLGLDFTDTTSNPQNNSQNESSAHSVERGPDRSIPQKRVAMYSHRSSPSWSSQQSAYYQHKIATSATAQNKSPPFVKRLSALGFGLGITAKTRDDSPSGLSAPQHLHQSGDDFGVLQDANSSSHSNNNRGRSNSDQQPSSFVTSVPSILSENNHNIPIIKRGKFAFNKYQLKFLPDVYRPPARMATGMFES
ncbi:Inositol polyphosphate 4-phosphatase type II [Linnemannia zychae]|nr:Inositol polyphosphate 4-phosphatase type II [Linnemannia zychae]